MVSEIMEAMFDTLDLARDLASAVFDTDIPEPPLDFNAWQELCETGGQLEGMTIEQAQEEYALYLADQISKLQHSIDSLVLEIERRIADGSIPDTPEMQAFLRELSHHPITDETGHLIDPGGLKEQLGTGKWILDHYNFETKQLVYEVLEPEYGEVVEKVNALSPEEVISQGYWYTTQRSIMKLTVPKILLHQENIV